MTSIASILLKDSPLHDLTHEEVLLLQEELGKLPDWSDYFFRSSLAIGALFFISWTNGLLEKLPTFISLLVLFLLLGVVAVWKDLERGRLLRKDLIHRQKTTRHIFVESKKRSFGDDLYHIYSAVQKEPIPVNYSLFQRLKKGDELVIWESFYAKVELSKEAGQ